MLRFSDRQSPFNSITHWMSVFEAGPSHFLILNHRLTDFDSFFDAMRGNKGLWQSAERAPHDLFARLAIGPLVLQAQGLDKTPQLIY